MSRNKCLSESQLQNRLAKLQTAQQLAFIQHADPLISRECEHYLTVLSESRQAIANAITELRGDLDNEIETAKDEAEEINQLDTPFDTSTAVGKSLASISQEFVELIKLQRAKTALYPSVLSQDENAPGSNKETQPDVLETMLQMKKKKKNKTLKNDLNSAAKKAELNEQLEAASKTEREAILEKVEAHGHRIDKERKRQMDSLDEKRRKARKKTDRTEAVDNIMDKKQELDDLYQRDKDRQGTALKERLGQRKLQELEAVTTDPLKEEENFGMQMTNGLPTKTEQVDETVQKKKRGKSSNKKLKGSTEGVPESEEVHKKSKASKKKQSKEEVNE